MVGFKGVSGIGLMDALSTGWAAPGNGAGAEMNGARIDGRSARLDD
jgi:hypothetical protein